MRGAREMLAALMDQGRHGADDDQDDEQRAAGHRSADRPRAQPRQGSAVETVHSAALSRRVFPCGSLNMNQRSKETLRFAKAAAAQRRGTKSSGPTAPIEE